MNPYLKRTLEPVLIQAASEFPAVIVSGPRQSGKTTLLKHLFAQSHRYLSLEPPDVRAAALADPRGFLERFPPPVIFDEVQYAPELLSYIKEAIDARRAAYGQYLLTSSQNLLLTQHANETLAGRAAMLRLLPLSYPEIVGQPLAPFHWESPTTQLPAQSFNAFWASLLRGSYPEVVDHPRRQASLWQGSYIQTYLERDVRNLRHIGDLSQFQLFLRAIAARSAQLFQLSDVARDIGVAVNTAKAWLTILEATFQILLIRPYFANMSKRLVKTPKVYLTDAGLLCYLLGLQTMDHILSGPMAGAIMETFVVSEVFKRLLHRGQDPHLYFWRTATGTEVDLLIEQQGKLIPIEIKSSATPRPHMAEGILSLKHDLGEHIAPGYVVYPGTLELPLAPGVLALPISHL